jgi:hypothetical protein
MIFTSKSQKTSCKIREACNFVVLLKEESSQICPFLSFKVLKKEKLVKWKKFAANSV